MERSHLFVPMDNFFIQCCHTYCNVYMSSNFTYTLKGGLTSLAKNALHSLKYFTAIKVFCCAFSESFTLHDWSKVSQWVMSLSLRKLDVVHLGSPQNVIERSESASSVLNSDTNRRSSRLTSVSGQSCFRCVLIGGDVFTLPFTGQTSYDSYLAFYNALLVHVYEGLLLVHHIPLFSFLWPLLRQIEFQVRI